MSEVAFTVMDLDDRSRPDLARRFLNRYLEITGDYAGLAVLPFYRTYRALVRAKIHRLRAAQLEGGPAQSGALAEYRGYVDLARSYTGRRRAGLILTHGPSGCGKTALSQRLLEVIEAVRIRSDVERKRLRGVGPLQRSTEGIGRGLYTLAATDATYHRAHTLARKVLSAGFVTVVDATFLQRWHRDLFRKLAAELRVPFVIVSLLGRESTLRERITRRAAEGDDASDADLAVLEHQLRAQQPFGADERADVVEFDTERSIESAGGREAWRGVIDRLAPTASE
jgi:predicted kinase